jgi:glycosyltransferase involved in cell wall biosynthesis
VNHYPVPETMHPDISADGGSNAELTGRIACYSSRGTARSAMPLLERRPVSPHDPLVARSLVGLAGLPTIVAIGPFDDSAHAEVLAAAFTTVRLRCRAQLVLVGNGVQRAAVTRRTLAQGVGANVHSVRITSDNRWSDLVAAADVVVPGPASGPSMLLEVMAVGRAVVAPLSPATARLVVPASAGLLYRPGDLAGMARAMLRLITSPALRQGMAARASEVARRHRVQHFEWQRSDEGNDNV